MGRGVEHRDCDDLRGHVFYRSWAYHVGLQLGDIPVEAEVSGVEYGSGGEQSDERCDIDDVFADVERDDYRRSVLFVRWDCDGGLGVFLYVLAGDAREDA